MIGMMNNGEMEVYASARQSSLYDNRKRSNQSRTYTPEGRVMINGEPKSPIGQPEDMWKNVIVTAAATRMIKGAEKKSTNPLDAFRRISNKLKFKKSKSPSTEDHDKIFEIQSSSVSTNSNYVTIIQIDSVDENETHTDRPDFLNFEQDGILARLLDESYHQRPESDSGKGSIENEIVGKS